jgi:hypothetical protein
MIFACSFEEICALEHGARSFLGEPVGGGAVAAPPAARAAVEYLLPRLTGDLSFATLADRETAERAVRALVLHLKRAMDAGILASHPADEPTVAAYFDYAHALTVLHRLEGMGREMLALFELLKGGEPDAVEFHTFIFPD